MSTIADRIKEGLKLRNMKQADLVKLTGIGKSSISTYLTGAYEPKQKNIYKIAKALNVSEAWLMGYDVDYTKQDTPYIPDGFLPPPTMVKKPRLGKISCGEPLLTEENFDGYDNVPADIKCDFTLVCQGDSMIGARIHDGDLVYIRQQPTVETGQIAAVLIDGTEEKLLKRVFIHTDSIVLQAENPAYSPLVFVGTDMNNVRIIGKAVGFTSIIK